MDDFRILGHVTFRVLKTTHSSYDLCISGLIYESVSVSQEL